MARKRDLLSLVGLLVHAGKAVRPGRAYVRQLIDLGSTASHNDHYVRINCEARADLEWRHLFLETWNGVAMMTANSREVPDIVLTSDASGNWCCGAYSGGKWFMLPWSTKFQSCHITVKELAPPRSSGGKTGGEDNTSKIRQLSSGCNYQRGHVQKPPSR